MKKSFFVLFQLLLFSDCSISEKHEKYPNPLFDKSTSIYNHIKADTTFNKLLSKDFRIIEVMSKKIPEGFVVSARILLNRKEVLQNETQDSMIWINDIIISPNNEILKWGSIGKKSNLLNKFEGEKTYHTPIIIKK
jgi:hypothetical protein